MGSSRFPGKMLKKLGNYYILEWVIRRLNRSKFLDDIVVATTTSPIDDLIEEKAQNFDANVFRGSSEDVLERFIQTSRYFNIQTVVRVCGDNPFIAPEEIDRLINFFKKNPCDYACNHQDKLNSGYADGFGAEIIPSSVLYKIETLTQDKRHREHVTTYMLENPKKYRLMSVPAPDGLRYPNLCFDINTIEDKMLLETLIEIGVTINSNAFEIVNLYLSQFHEPKNKN